MPDLGRSWKAVAALLLLAGVACTPAAAPAPSSNPVPTPAVVASSVAVPSAAPAFSPLPLAGASPSPSLIPGLPSVLPSPQVAAYTGPTTNLMVGYNSPDPAYCALWLAVDDGIFEQNGLHVDLQLLSVATQSVAALLSGQLQFIQSGASTILTPNTTGANLDVLAVWLPVQNYVFDVAPGIHSAADLKGKTVAMDAVGASGDLALVMALQQLGLNPDTDVNIVAIGATPDRATALLSGQVQGTVLSPPTYVQVESQGYTRLVDLAALHLPQAGQSTIAQQSWIAANHDVTQRYVNAMMEANLRVKRDKPAALAVMRNHLQGVSDDVLSQVYDFYAQEVWPDVPTPDPSVMTDATNALAATVPQVKDLNLASYMDPSFVQAAVAQGIQ